MRDALASPTHLPSYSRREIVLRRLDQVERQHFDERFSMLVDAEHLARDNRRLRRLLKDAQLRISNACVEDVEASAARGLDKAMLRQLVACTWITEHLNVMVCGPTGVGKSFLACALGQLARRRGHRGLYRLVSRLHDELALARAEGSYARKLTRLAKSEILILDDWGLSSLREAQRHDLLEVIEDRKPLIQGLLVAREEVFRLWG